MSESATEGSVRPAATNGWVSALAYCAYCEVAKSLRIPIFAVSTFLLPVLLFSMFALPYVDGSIEGINAGRYMMSSWGTYAVMALSIFSFGASIATERGQRWNLLLRTTPLTTSGYFAAKAIMAVVLGTMSLTVLFAFGAIVGGVSMPAYLWADLGGLLLLGMLPFVAMGLFLGYVAGPNSAAAFANLIFLPLAFASGLFIPLQALPQVVQDVSPYLPSYHVAQLGWHALGAGDGSSMGVHLAWIAGYAILFLALAFIAYRRDEGKTFG